MRKEKILIVIQARFGSRRLPGKVLKPLYKGNCIIDILIDRFNRFNCVLAVPKSEVNLFNRFPVPIVSGSEINVLSRIKDVVRQYKPKIVVRVCADNPFIDLFDVYSVISNAEIFGYGNNWNMPEGCRVEAFRAELLDEADLKKDREHVTVTMREKFYKKYKLSMDTERDYKRIKKIFERAGNIRVDMDEVPEYLYGQNPEKD